MLEIAVTNTDRLVRLINDILDLERIESGKVELTRGTVDAQAIMDQAREGLQSMADQARIRIVSNPAIGSLWGDSDRIIQTLTNLLGNASSFLARHHGHAQRNGRRNGLHLLRADEDAAFRTTSSIDLPAFQSRRRVRFPQPRRLRTWPGHQPEHRHRSRGRIWAKGTSPGTRFQFTFAGHPAVDLPSAIEQPAVPLTGEGPTV